MLAYIMLLFVFSAIYYCLAAVQEMYVSLVHINRTLMACQCNYTVCMTKGELHNLTTRWGNDAKIQICALTTLYSTLLESPFISWFVVSHVHTLCVTKQHSGTQKREQTGENDCSTKIRNVCNVQCFKVIFLL